MPLVEYSSSEDEDLPVKRPKVDQESSARPKSGSSTPSTRRRLPKLPEVYDGPADDPSAHQGRVRARKYVQGDYYAHVYIELPISPDLRPVIDGMIDIARDSVPGVEIHSFLDGSSPPSRAVSEGASPTPSRTRSESPDSAPALHVSLTHPLSLRGHVARTLVSDLGAAFRKARISPFTASLSTPKIYHNTSTPRRAFIALRVGAGVRELQEILEKIVRPHLRRYHVEAYYDRPEWHASFAWCLDGGELSDTSPFPASLVADLGQPKTHAWQVSEICVKVGKEVTRIPL